MDIAAVTMSYRSPPLLAKWIAHYGRMFGNRNLFIVSHGHCEEQEALAKGCNYLTVPRDEFTPHIARLKSRTLGDLCACLLHSYGAVVCGDADELIVSHPDSGMSLPEHIEALPDASIVAPVGLNIMPRASYYDLDEPATIELPLLRQCNRVSLASNFCKPSIVKRPPRFAPGNHWLMRDEFELDRNLVLFHTKYLALNGLSFYQDMASDVRSHADKTGMLKHRVWVKGIDGLRMMSNRLEMSEDRIADPKNEASALSFDAVSDKSADKRVVGPKLGSPFQLSDRWLDLV